MNFCRVFNGFVPLFCHQKLFAHLPNVHTILRKFTAFWRKLRRKFGPISEVGRNLLKRLFDGLIITVRVYIQGDTCVRVSHEILQTFHIQTGLLCVGAKGVP